MVSLVTQVLLYIFNMPGKYKITTGVEVVLNRISVVHPHSILRLAEARNKSGPIKYN